MIVSENSFCIYCRGVLSTNEEIENQFHTDCRNEFLFEASDLEIFDVQKVREKIEFLHEKLANLKKQNFKIIPISIVFTLLLILVLLNNTTINAILVFSLYIVEAFIILFFVRRYQIIEDIKHFYSIVLIIRPQFMYLTEKYNVVKIGEIYILNKYAFWEFAGIYMIKFLKSNTINKSKLKIPGPPFVTQFNKQKYNLLFARRKKTCQIPHNSYRSVKGQAVIYSIRFNDIFRHESGLNNLVFLMNRETLFDAPTIQSNSRIKILLMWSIPIAAYAAVRVIAFNFFK